MQTSLQTRLTRSSDDRVLAGVCGGLARYFEVDSTLVRLIAVMLAFTGMGLLGYIVLWVVMPPAGAAQQVSGVRPGPGARFDPMTGQPLDQASPDGEAVLVSHTTPQSRHRVLGIGLLALGAFLLAERLMPWITPMVFPALLIGAGYLLLVRARPSS